MNAKQFAGQTAIAALVLILGWAPSASAQKVGTTAMQFLKVAPTARAMGMGSAYSSLANGAQAAYWNPAGLTQTEKYDLAMDRVEWLLDTAHNGLSYAQNVGGLGYFGVF